MTEPDLVCCCREGWVDVGCKIHGLKSTGFSYSASKMDNVPMSLDDMVKADAKEGKVWRDKGRPKR